MTFKEKLVILRKAKGLTQDEFAAAVGVSRQAVYKWECGQSYPEVPKLLEMKLLFTISIDELLDDNYDIPVPEKKKRKRISKEAAAKIENTVKREINIPAAPKPQKPAPKPASSPAKVEDAPAPVYSAPATVAAAAPVAEPTPKVTAFAEPKIEIPAAPVEEPVTVPTYEEEPVIKIEETFVAPTVIELTDDDRPINIPKIDFDEEDDDTDYTKYDNEENNKKVGFFGRIFGKK